MAHERVARQIIDGKLDGTVSKMPNELHVYVRGDRARMLEILRRGGIFADKAELHLVRIRQTPAEYEHSLIEAQRRRPQ